MPWAGVSTNPQNATGALYASDLKGGYTYGTQTNYQAYTLNLDAKRCNEIYGNSDSVQPPVIVLIPQIKY